MLAHEPSDKFRDIIVALCVNGIPQARIAAHIGIDAKTMRKFYRRELDLGTERANAEVTANVFRIASTAPMRRPSPQRNIGSAARVGWRDVSRHEVDVPSNAGGISGLLKQCGLDEPESIARELIAKRLDELNKKLIGGHQVVDDPVAGYARARPIASWPSVWDARSKFSLRMDSSSSSPSSILANRGSTPASLQAISRQRPSISVLPFALRTSG
jgi:hypothetical protein